ncbi:response regulator [Ruminiclostridium cellulolyticum]|uniref:Stage 0 sporulation protein A homolog n=1 Tax=Ruminiclostridium cellulolyticum (strain ATCC 35319 / DSM 5812 / JCM 6584 / H10) TaxID=394503 RepID=B8I2K3_RUMCH|nr:response regulator [Ruminiclostridium cellulolyticum]ACL75996.1 two component transcriptional regulator, AraC family [Ruminiclostridium cellulolyticum H10]
MFKILVADDEDVIRKGIVVILKRELANIDICCIEAENGIEALKLCKEHLPQLVITDIRMPFCDGLNLIKNIKETGYSPTFIILSGYADFEYAKSAIKLGVKEYVLKPIKKHELVSMVEGYVKSLANEKQRIDEKFARESENKKVVENVKQKLLRSLLDSTDAEESNRCLTELYDLGIHFSEKLLLCAIIQYQVNNENKDYIDFAVKNIADEVLTQKMGKDFLITVQYESGRLAAVFEGLKRETMFLSVKQELNKICNLVRKYLMVDVFAGIGDAVYGSTLLHKTFNFANMATNYKLYRTGNSVQLFSEIPMSLRYEQIDWGNLIRPLKNINNAEIINSFEKLIRLTPSLQSLSVIEQSYTKLVDSINRQLVKYNSTRTESIIKPLPFFELWSFLQLKQEINRYLNQVCQAADEAGIDVPNKKLIVEVLQFVRENAASDINLNIVAEKFDRTPAYMSALFKKGTGMGFNEYITSIRMAMAKKLLADTSIPIGEVSGLCGYINPKYFSVVFKNTFGVSPVVYRQNSMH